MVEYTGTLVDDPTFGRESITEGTRYTDYGNPISDLEDPAPAPAPDLGPLGDLAAPSLPSDITIGRPATAEEQLENAAKDYISDPSNLPGLISMLGDALPGVAPGALLAVANPAAMLLAAGKGLKGLHDFVFGPETTQSFEWDRDQDKGPSNPIYDPRFRYEDLFPFVDQQVSPGLPSISTPPGGWQYPPGLGPPGPGNPFDSGAGPGLGAPGDPGPLGIDPSEDAAPGEGEGGWDISGDPGGYADMGADWGSPFQEGGLASLSRNRGSSLRPGQESGILRTSFQEGGPAYTGTKVDAMDEMSDEKREELNLAIDDATRTAVEEFGIIEGKRLGEGTPYYYGPSSRDTEKGLDYSKQALRDMEWTQAEIDKLGEMSSINRFKFNQGIEDFLHKQAYLPWELREEYPRGNTRKDLDDLERMLEGPSKLPSHMVPRKSLTAAAKRTFAEGMADMVEAFRTPGGLRDTTGIGAGEFFTGPSGGFWSRLSSAFTDTTGPGTFWGGAGPAYGVVDDGRGGTRAPVGPDDVGGILDNGQVWDSGSASGPPGGDPGGYAAMGADWGSPFQEGGLASLYPKPNRGSSLRPGQESGILRQGGTAFQEGGLVGNEYGYDNAAGPYLFAQPIPKKERDDIPKKEWDDMRKVIESWVLRHKGYAEGDIMPQSGRDTTGYTRDEGWVPDPSILGPRIKKGGNVFGFETSQDLMRGIIDRGAEPNMADARKLRKIEEREKFVDESFKPQSRPEETLDFRPKKITEEIRRTKIDPKSKLLVEKYDFDQLRTLYTAVVKPEEGDSHSLPSMTKFWDSVELSEEERRTWLADAIASNLLDYPTLELYETPEV